jgi:hypothetical protein
VALSIRGIQSDDRIMDNVISAEIPSSGRSRSASLGETDLAIPTADSTTPTSSSSDFDIDIEKQEISNAPLSKHDYVDIQYAEEQFDELKKRYSNLSRVHSLEKAERREDEFKPEEGFDLEDVLRDRHQREKEHDFKPKHLGRSYLIPANVRRSI